MLSRCFTNTVKASVASLKASSKAIATSLEWVLTIFSKSVYSECSKSTGLSQGSDKDKNLTCKGLPSQLSYSPV